MLTFFTAHIFIIYCYCLFFLLHDDGDTAVSNYFPRNNLICFGCWYVNKKNYIHCSRRRRRQILIIKIKFSFFSSPFDSICLNIPHSSSFLAFTWRLAYSLHIHFISSQFHQHYSRAFFVRKSFWQLFFLVTCTW